MKKQKENSLENIAWSEMGKQNVQAKEVYFQESNNEKPWNMQSIPTAIVENANAKILWDTPIQLESFLENAADKIDIAVLDKQGKSWLLIEGTVCQEGRMKKKTSMKQENHIDLRKGIKNLYKDHTVTQINVVFDFLGGYYTKMEKRT